MVTLWNDQRGHRAGLGEVAGPRVFGGDTSLERVFRACSERVVEERGSECDWLAARDSQLQCNQVEVGDLFGDGVFDLDAGVHLEEEELVGGGIDDELDGADRVVANLRGELDCCPTHFGFDIAREVGRWGLFEHFLIAPLHRALASSHIDDGAMFVASHLHLDMAGSGDVALDDHIVVSKGPQRFGLGIGECLGEAIWVLGDPDALTAAARRCLHEDRVPNVGCGSGQVVGVLAFVETRDHRNSGSDRHGAGLDLGSHRRDRGGRGPNPRQACTGNRFGEFGAFGQETVAGMNVRCARALSSIDERVDREIALVERCRADTFGLGCLRNVRRVFVGVGIDGHTGDAPRVTGANDAPSNLATVGNEDDHIRVGACDVGIHAITSGTRCDRRRLVHLGGRRARGRGPTHREYRAD